MIPNMLRRHPILFCFAFLVLLVAALVGVFLATFDLNDYRRQLENQLSSRLGVPVEFGRAQLSINAGLALGFSDVRIGTGTAGTLVAEHLYLRLAPLALLERRLAFTAVTLEAPQLSLTREALSQQSGLLRGWPPSVLNTVRAEQLEITNGRITLIDRSEPQRPVTLAIRNLSMEISRLAPGNPGRFHMSSILEHGDQQSALTLSGHLALPASSESWQHTALDLNLRLKDFAPGHLLERYLPNSLRCQGQAGLRADLKGSPASGLRIAAQLDGRPLRLLLGESYQKPLTVNSASLHATWTQTSKQHDVLFTRVALNGLALEGNLRLIPEDAWFLQGEVHAPELSLPRIVSTLPIPHGSFLAEIEKGLAGGNLVLERAVFDGALQPPSSAWLQEGKGPIKTLHARLENAAWHASGSPEISDIKARLRMTEQGLVVENGGAQIWNQNLTFAGSAFAAPHGRFELSARIAGELPAAEIVALLPPENAGTFSVQGLIPLTATLTGTPREARLRIQAGLDSISLRSGAHVRKEAGTPGELQMEVRFGDESLILEAAKLSLGGSHLTLKGTLGYRAPYPFDLECASEQIFLNDLPRLLPATAVLHPVGSARLSLHLKGRSGRFTQHQGSLVLQNAGWQMGKLLAPIREAEARLDLHEEQIRIISFKGKLGEAPISAEGHLSDFTEPRLELNVEGRDIRADALIFPSPSGQLENVQGGLIIARDLIRFDQIRTELSGGTRAIVNGSVRDFKTPHVELDISAEYGNIDEVIRLFIRPKGAEKPKRPPEKNPITVQMTARAEHGQLGNLRFQQAEGTIRYRRGILTIYPLHFTSNGGYFVGRVMREGTGDAPHLMKISGHLENFDAAMLYHQQFERRGLITGRLRGGFYLEGRGQGRQFLKSSRGGFYIRVEDGVLRKLQILSKVFSLLNVSQIFALDLPDMSTEGMPFNSARGAFSLKNGVLESEDLLIDSNAMDLSMVGFLDMAGGRIDATLGVKPLGTVDKIVTRIPIAGWILGGEEKALITAHFRIDGDISAPKVTPIPITSLSEKVRGVFKRVLGLPGKVITDVGQALDPEDDFSPE